MLLSLEAAEESHEPSNPVDQEEGTRLLAQTREQHLTTEDYLQENYVNGNPSCPKDIQEAHEQRCEAGDEGSCKLVRYCDPQSSAIVNVDE